MSDPRGAEAAPASTAPAQWSVLAATAVGASHQASGRPGQDAFGFAPSDHTVDRPLAVAVADGHGHRIHFRSQEGARLAVKVGCDAFLRAAGSLAGCVDAETAQAQTVAVVLPELVEQWRAACKGDLAARPVSVGELEAVGFPEEERANALDKDDPLLAYGSTLMVAALTGRWLVLAHIGDGDVFTVEMDGTATSPVPGDPLLDGQRTTSLCQPDALDAFRTAVLDLDQRTPAMIGLATDGYGNAQIRDEWQPAVGADLARYLQHQGRAWVGAQLTDWVARCASVEGSADDTTVALLISPRAEEVAAPAAPATPTASNGGSGGQDLATKDHEPSALLLGPPGATGALLEATRERTLPMAPTELPAFSVTGWPSSGNQYFPGSPSGGGSPPGAAEGRGGAGPGGNGPRGPNAAWAYPGSAAPASAPGPPPTKTGRRDPRLPGRVVWVAVGVLVVLVAVVVVVIAMTAGGNDSKHGPLHISTTVTSTAVTSTTQPASAPSIRGIPPGGFPLPTLTPSTPSTTPRLPISSGNSGSSGSGNTK